MRHSPSLLSLSAGLLLALAVPVDSAPPAKKPAETKIPYTCETQAWDGAFEIVGSRFDKPSNRVIWTLRAKVDGPVAAYEAFVVDPDEVEVDTIKVKFTPASPKVKAGARLQAVLSLGSPEGEPAKITIRKCR